MRKKLLGFMQGRFGILWCLAILFSLFFVAKPTPVNATTINVSTTGNDETGDGSSGSPWATIQKGIDSAIDDDVVIVATGTYKGTGNKDISFKGKSIVVESVNGAANCIINCEASGRGFIFNSNETSSSVLRGFTIQNGAPGYIHTGNFGGNIGGAILAYNASPKLENLIIKSNNAPNGGGGIFCGNNSSQLKITNCIFSNNKGFEGSALIADDGNTVVVAENCVFYDNGSSSSVGTVYGNYGKLNIINCTIVQNTGYGVGGWGGGTVNISNSIIWDNSTQNFYGLSQGRVTININYSDVQGGYTGTGNIDSDPLFADTINDDYSLSNSSPCIGAGTSTGAPSTDVKGNIRPNPAGSTPDMGAYENSLGIPSSSTSPTPTPTPSDTTAPSGSISINSGASYTNSSNVTLTLSATDATGVTGYFLSDSATTPSASASGWTSVTSTTSYSASVSYTLSSGEGSKTIYVWYKDAAGNVSSVANATITLDTTVPTVTISSPTSSSTYTATSSTISLGGSASDSSSGISTVTWSNDRGGNGTATGTASWTVSSISLSTGDNVITVTAKDGANNSGTDTLQVTYGTSSTVSVPTVSTGSASSVTTSSATLSGTVNANGGTTTAWFQYGTTSGSYGNTSSTQTVTGSSNTTVSIGISGLSSGTNYYYRIAAQNSAGTSYGSESSVTTTSAATPTPTPSTGDTTAPTVTITSPTSSSTYTTTSSTITLSGTASDNSGSVSTVTWSNSKGGSGTASGTTSWTISSISLSSGDNVITVTATDGSGNSGTDTITVTYNATTTQPPTATTGAATNVTATSATVTGTVNANGLSTTAWFEYGTVKGTYSNKTTTQTVTGSNDTTVSSAITGLTAETTYYYRIAAQNNSGTSYGEEMSFQYSSKGSAPTVTTEAATDVTSTSATLNGKCNPNGLSTTAWFEYGTLSGTYEYQTSTQSMSGSSYTKVSAAITGLTAGTKYYYRIVAKNSVGTSYGTEVEFYKSPGTDTTPTPAVTPTPKISPAPTLPPLPTPAPTLPPLPTPHVSPSPIQEGIVFGFVNDEDELPLKGVTVTIVGANGRSPYQDSTETDENGYYEFSGLEAGDYAITYEKDDYETQTQNISLEEGELKDLGTVTMEQSVSGKIYGYVVDIKGNPLEFVRLRLKGVKTKVIKTASSDADGFFEFADLDADTYVIIAKKKGYRKNQQKVKLEEGASEEIEIVMKKTSKKVRGLLPKKDFK